MPLLIIALAIAVPILAFFVICAVSGAAFIGPALFGIVMAAFGVAWLFEMRRLVDMP